MQFMDAVKIAFKKYADFRGVASRAEYWWWILFTLIISIFAAVIDYSIGGEYNDGIVAMIVNLAFFLPTLSILVRRFRDTGVSPFWLLTWLIPVGVLVAVIVANISNFMFLAENAESLMAQIQSIAGDEAAAMAFLEQNPNLISMLMSFLVAIGVFILWAIFELVVTLLPTKKAKQASVATIDY